MYIHRYTHIDALDNSTSAVQSQNVAINLQISSNCILDSRNRFLLYRLHWNISKQRNIATFGCIEIIHKKSISIYIT